MLNYISSAGNQTRQRRQYTKTYENIVNYFEFTIISFVLLIILLRGIFERKSPDRPPIMVVLSLIEFFLGN